jgi:predicted protein tyrosine phosphatase
MLRQGEEPAIGRAVRVPGHICERSRGLIPSSANRTGPIDISWLTETLAVGGSFPLERCACLVADHGVRAVIDMRAETCDDRDVLDRHSLTLLHLPTPDMHGATRAMLDEGVHFASAHLTRQEPVLIHCQHGIGRSALLALCVLVESGRDPLEALAHAKRQRPMISPSQSQYEAWADWLRSRGHRPPNFQAFADIAYKAALD